MSFKFYKCTIPEVILIKSKDYKDRRGSFLESYARSEFEDEGIPGPIDRVIHSMNLSSVLRGLHYQLGPHAQGKLVSVTRGEITDIAVDIRRGSPTFGKHVKAFIGHSNGGMLYVPEGFAHGFYVTSGPAEVMYFITGEYHPESARGIRWDDPELGIEWNENKLIISDKDKELPLLKDAEINFEYLK